MKNISFSAPGSVILVGEYALLFGKPALASAMNFFSTAFYSQKIQNSKDNTIQSLEMEIKGYLKKRNLLNEEKSCHIQFTSDIPAGDTFGYDDTKIVVIVGLMLRIFSKKTFSRDEIPTISYQIEKKINKKELGIHCTASTFGGLVYYRKEFEFLKNISSLNMKISKGIEEHLFLIDTGKADESNEELENFVGKLYNTNTKKAESIFQDIEKTTKRFLVSMIKEDKEFFKRCIIEHEHLLEDLGVVSRLTQHIIRNIEEFGAAKIIGNGGRRNKSGFLLGYFENEQHVKKIANKYRLTYFPFKQSAIGLEEKII